MSRRSALLLGLALTLGPVTGGAAARLLGELPPSPDTSAAIVGQISAPIDLACHHGECQPCYAPAQATAFRHGLCPQWELTYASTLLSSLLTAAVLWFGLRPRTRRAPQPETSPAAPPFRPESPTASEPEAPDAPLS